MTLVTVFSEVPEQQAVLERLTVKAKGFVEEAAAGNTRRAYADDWAHFTDWCASVGLQALPATPQTVALYLTHMTEAGYQRRKSDGTPYGEFLPYKVATLQRHLSTISRVHQLHGLEFLTKAEPLYSTFKGIRRQLGTAPTKKAALLLKHLRQMVALAPNGRIGLRDRALLLLWWAAAERRSEVVAAKVEHLTFTEEGIALLIPDSKTDQEGKGYTLPIHYGKNPATCPVKAVRAWLEASGIQSGPVFGIGDRQAARVLKNYATKIGLDAATIGGHSPRRGWITEAARNKEPLHVIMKHSRHESERVAMDYIEEATLFEDSAGARIGL